MNEFYSSEEWLEMGSGHPGGCESTTWLLEQSGLKEGSHVLDFCCGKGDDMGTFLSAGCCVTGVDGSGEAIRAAKKRYSNSHLVSIFRWEGDRLYIPDNSQDGVLCQCSLSLFKGRISEVLREFRRVLKPGGVLLLSDLYGVYNEKKEGVFPDEKQWHTYLKEMGFLLQNWKDGTDLFREYCMEYLWRTGNRFPVCSYAAENEVEIRDVGYFLSVWR